MRDGTETGLRLRREALRLFVERGVDAVSVRDIALAAEVQPSTLYVHWKSRDELVAVLFRDGFANYAARLKRVAATAGNFSARLESVIRQVCTFYREDPSLFRFLLINQHGHLDSVPREDSPIEVVEQMFRAAMAAGQIKRGNPALLTAAVVGIVVQAATFHHYGRLEQDLVALGDEICRLCVNAVL